MKPYGRTKKIMGCGRWKIDYHPKRGFMNWWEEFKTIIPRTTIKSEVRKQINEEL